MSKSKTTKQLEVAQMPIRHEDVMQAIFAALVFGEDAGLGAMAAHEAGAPETVYPGAGNVVHLSRAASYLLADTQSMVLEAREEGYDFEPDRINHWHLDRDAAPDEAAEIDMSEVTPGNTERVYTDQPIPPRES